MSKLDDLIKEKCPNGVNYIELGEVCEITKGRGLSKSDKGTGNIPIILYGELYTTYGNYIDEVVSFASETAKSSLPIAKNDLLLPVSSTTKEAQIGKASVYRLENECYLGGDAIRLRHEQNPGFLMYVINSTSFEKQKMKCVSGTTISHLNPGKLSKIKVPVPPLEVQNEIVQILDNFAELTAELSNRKKQYEYYRDLLLNFDENKQRAKYVLLGDCCKMIVGGDIPKDAFSKTESSDFHIPILSNGIGDNAIYGYTNRARVTDACVTFSARGTIGYSALREKPFFPIVRLICAVPDISILTPKYLYYVSQTLTFQVPKSGIPQLTVPMLSKYKIPIPSLEEQNRITQALERFDKITTDISEGLPAEIEAREKQYIYYRDKLLSFKELASNA